MKDSKMYIVKKSIPNFPEGSMVEIFDDKIEQVKKQFPDSFVLYNKSLEELCKDDSVLSTVADKLIDKGVFK